MHFMMYLVIRSLLVPNIIIFKDSHHPTLHFCVDMFLQF